jgi:hypothetical protein
MMSAMSWLYGGEVCRGGAAELTPPTTSRKARFASRIGRTTFGQYDNRRRAAFKCIVAPFVNGVPITM